MSNGVNRSALAAILVLLSAQSPAPAAVRLVVGPTPIPGGEAKSAGDITVINEKLAFAIAVTSSAPYGVPRGAIIDIAAIRGGKIGRDRAVFADFIPNNWSAWPNTYQRVEILENGPRQVVVQAVRDWGASTISTRYTLRQNADRVEISTTMTNGGAHALPGLLSGFALWPKGGFLFGVPGMEGARNGPATDALADRVVAYDADWSVALHAPYLDEVAFGSKDLYRRHTLEPGASRRFDGWLQVGSSGNLGPVIRAEIERKQLASGTVGGSVRDAGGKRVAEPVIVIETQGKPYGWVSGANGSYSVELPVGEYALYATARGYSQSASSTLKVGARAALKHDFSGLQRPGKIHFVVADGRSGAPLDARLAITQGQKPVVEFLGRKTFFTELDRKGVADVELAPGDYVFSVSAGGHFLAEAVDLALSVAPGTSQSAAVKLLPFAAPAARGWYAADLHHHADQAEGVTPPADLARSQLAAGLDLLFVSDHDSMANLPALQRIAERRGIPFMGSMEISTSWAHFNAFPLAAGQTLAVDTSTASVDQIFAEARRLGAAVVQVNHPFIPYGYFASVEARLAPGGYNPGFDLIELNVTEAADDDKVVQRAWSLWNQGRHYYLSGGTDTHDVWNAESGRLRTFAHVGGELTAGSFAAALKAGRSYVSNGPLIFPDTIFGAALKLKPGQAITFGYELKSLAGIRRAQLVKGGVPVASRTFADLPREVRVEFGQAAGTSAWYALVVEDSAGRKAYTNPVWVDAGG